MVEYGPWGPEPGFLRQLVYEETVGPFSFRGRGSAKEKSASP